MSKRMHEPTFLILTALVGGPLHGYALRDAATQVSDGETRLQVGTLYAALDRLDSAGLVEVVSEEIVNGRARRSYGVTAAGRESLATEAERMASLADQARRRLAVGGLGTRVAEGLS